MSTAAQPPSALERGEFLEHMLELPLSSLAALGRVPQGGNELLAPTLEGQELELREEGVRVRREHPVLGTMVLDSTNECWSCEKELGGTLVEVCVRLEVGSLCSQSELNAASGIEWETLADGWLRVDARAVEARAFAAQELLERCNREWRTTPEGETEAALDAAEFQAGLRLREVWLEADGSASLWHDDSDMFWGHRVVVELTPSGEPGRAWLAG